jgi:hypothetical protein
MIGRAPVSLGSAEDGILALGARPLVLKGLTGVAGH